MDKVKMHSLFVFYHRVQKEPMKIDSLSLLDCLPCSKYIRVMVASGSTVQDISSNEGAIPLGWYLHKD